LKVGLSTYSLLKVIESGEMSILDVIDWIAENGGEHMEIVPYGFSLADNRELADEVRERARSKGLALSNYSMPAHLAQHTPEAFNEEIERIKQHVDLVNRLGMKHMRHDVIDFTLDPEFGTLDYFEKHLEQFVTGCRQIADYAAGYGITTTVENHSVCVQGSERVQRVLRLVDRPNFRTTLDIGNFLCVDEAPLVGVKRNLPYASLVHVKDFYIRPYYESPSGGEWFVTTHGNYLRGAILGHGDINIRQIVKLIKASGYDSYITLEFEGMEECRSGAKLGFDYVKRIWNEL